MAVCYIKVKSVSFFYIFSPLSMHLVQYSINSVIPLEKRVLCCMWNHKCNHIFSHPHIWNKNTSNPNFYRSKHVELTRREVQTVRRMFQDLKFKISDRPLKCLASCMSMGHCCTAKLHNATIVLFPCADSWLQFIS